ncbi:MAG: DegT/DnrJ/EryC1/StrS family aminotransferase [Bacteroidota bacterium]
MFIINPDKYSLPAYRIGPFRTADLANNHRIFENDSEPENVVDEYIIDNFGKNYRYTLNGREAIHLALSAYNLQRTDVVSILTTSQNLYISGCVTNEIEKYCHWNREITRETTLIFVNHEFGQIYEDMDSLVKTGLPIIEDCCTTFFSNNERMEVGKYGDFALYSFSKFFPIQAGGLLVNNSGKKVHKSSQLDSNFQRYIKKTVSHNILNINELLKKREEIYSYSLQQFMTLGFTERFKRKKGTVPSVLMLNNHGIIPDLGALKVFFWDHGIQTSIFYGEDAFFLPVHQNLEKEDIDYFVFVVKSFIDKK